MSNELEKWNARSTDLSVPTRAEIMSIDNREATAHRRQEAEARLSATWMSLGIDNVFDLAEKVEDRASQALQKIAATTEFNSPYEIERQQRLASIIGLTQGMIQVYAHDHTNRGRH